jgi:myo-inositol-1(or 4)-monophosphatase
MGHYEIDPDDQRILDAISAARMIMRSETHREVAVKPDGSLVTTTDKEVQSTILDILRTGRGTDLIIAEETTTEGDPISALEKAHGRWWGVDPIDGTTNFVSSVPLYCVSVGLCEGRRPLTGAVWDSTRDVIASSWETTAAPWREITSVGDLRIDIEYEGGGEDMGYASALAARLLPEARMVRTIGCAALALVWLSRGWIDAFFHPRLWPWDYAAGAAIVEAAGGIISSPFLGEDSRWVMAGSPSGFRMLQRLVSEIVPDLNQRH